MSEDQNKRLEWLGGTHAIGDLPILVGRDPVAADVSVEHDSLLSRLHFAIVPGPESTFLLDLRSSNGTFVNGARVHYSRLRDGDQIRAGTGRFEFRGGESRREPLHLLSEPRISFLAGTSRDPFLHFLRALHEAPDWQHSLQLAADCLLGCARESLPEGSPQPLAALGLGLEQGDPVARGIAGAPEASLAEVAGPLLARARQLDRPFLIEDLGRDLSFLPEGYPIRLAHLGSVAVAPLGPQAEAGIICLRSPNRRFRLEATHLLLVEGFALSLEMRRGQLLRDLVRGKD